jgi:SAM-dependent methyltransferase
MIVRPIQEDIRTRPNLPLGWDVSWIFNNAIGGGQADFDAPIENLTSYDRVMLYAYLNQKGHVDELIHAFDKLLPDLDKLRNATIIDIGCGPFTAGLALANVVGREVAYRYFGVDHSVSMCKLGSKLSNAVREAEQTHPETEISFHQDISSISFGKSRGSELTIFVLSYLLASTSIDIDQLTRQILTARTMVGLGASALLYTNTGRISARTLYPELCKKLTAIGFVETVEDVELFRESDRDRLIHYALFICPPVSKVSTVGFFK